MLIYQGKTYAQYEAMIASPCGGRRLGEEAEIMVDVNVLAFAKVSFNIQRLSTVELCRLCMLLSLMVSPL